MRFYEFAQLNRPILKISQQAQSQAAASANTIPTSFLRNTAPTPQTTEPIRVYPRAWQHEWTQKKLNYKVSGIIKSFQVQINKKMYSLSS